MNIVPGGPWPAAPRKHDPLWVRILVWPFLIVVAVVLLTGIYGCAEPACVPNLSEDADGGPVVLCK